MAEPIWKSMLRDRLVARVFRDEGQEFVPEQFASPASWQEGLKRQKAMLRWVLDLQLELFITQKFNEDLGEFEIMARLRRFDALLNHHWLGRDWAKYERSPSKDRVFFVAFIEQDQAGYGSGGPSNA